MKTLVKINTQIFENYGDIDTPYWKTKGTHEFNLTVDDDLFLYNEDICVQAIELMLFDKSNDYIRFMYINHKLMFQEPTKLDENLFLQKYESLNTQVVINE